MSGECVFCAIVTGRTAAHIVAESGDAVAFLDARPVFPGHVLVVPRDHIEVLAELPARLVMPVVGLAQRVATAMVTALGADGSFVAVNNKVSQSVPHLHVHVVPRRRGDGLRGFFWPRHRYASETEMADFAERLRLALA